MLLRPARTLSCLVAAAALVVTSELHAAVHTVDNLNDDGPGSLRQAVRQSTAGDTIVFAVVGTIPLTSGELVITRDLNIQGPTNAKVEVVGSRARAFNIVGAKLNVSHLSISGSVLAQFGGGGGAGGDGEGGAILNT